MSPNDAVAELERTDGEIATQDNQPVSQTCTVCPTHVTKISGPDEVYLGQTYTFKVEEYSREVQGDYWQEKVSWEVSLYREPEVWGPDRRQSVEKIVLSNHGEELNLAIKEEWAFLDMQVFAYINMPVDDVSIKPKVRGAWAVTGTWSAQKISEYRTYAKTTADTFFRGNVQTFVCEDFATTLVMQFARENNLPFKISNGTGLYDAKEYHYSEHDHGGKHMPFDQVMLKTTGAPDLNPANQPNTVPIVGSVDASSYNAALQANIVKSGMVHIMDTNRNGITNHIQVITDIDVQTTPPYANRPLTTIVPPYRGEFVMAKIEIHQGNFPDNTTAVIRGTGAFLSWDEEEDMYSYWYLGVPVQKGVYEMPSGNYTRNGGTSTGLLFQQAQAVVDWNFSSWN